MLFRSSCILSNLRNRVMRLFCQIPSIDIALINLLKSCMAYQNLLTHFCSDYLSKDNEQTRQKVEKALKLKNKRGKRTIKVKKTPRSSNPAGKITKSKTRIVQKTKRPEISPIKKIVEEDDKSSDE